MNGAPQPFMTYVIPEGTRIKVNGVELAVGKGGLHIIGHPVSAPPKEVR